eukprot:6207756-Pleurochrysis_carterae.AAC.5
MQSGVGSVLFLPLSTYSIVDSCVRMACSASNRARCESGLVGTIKLDKYSRTSLRLVLQSVFEVARNLANEFAVPSRPGGTLKRLARVTRSGRPLWEKQPQVQYFAQKASCMRLKKSSAPGVRCHISSTPSER